MMKIGRGKVRDSRTGLGELLCLFPGAGLSPALWRCSTRWGCTHQLPVHLRHAAVCPCCSSPTAPATEVQATSIFFCAPWKSVAPLELILEGIQGPPFLILCPQNGYAGLSPVPLNLLRPDSWRLEVLEWEAQHRINKQAKQHWRLSISREILSPEPQLGHACGLLVTFCPPITQGEGKSLHTSLLHCISTPTQSFPSPIPWGHPLCFASVILATIDRKKFHYH